MMKRVLTGLVVIVAVAAVARLVYVAPYPKPVGDDRIRAYSPDSAFVGTATTFEAVPFWGGRYRYVEFAIVRPDFTPVRSLVVIPPPNEPVYDYAEVGGLRWSADSLGIEADLFGAEVRLQLLESEAYRPWRPNPASQPTPGSSAPPDSSLVSTLPAQPAVLRFAGEPQTVMHLTHVKPILLISVLLVSGCLSFRSPHGFWNEPAVQVHGRLAGVDSSSDSVFIMRAPYFGAARRDEAILRRLVARLEGDTTDSRLRSESFPRRVARVSEDGAFSAAFPPAERYGALPPTGGWYWSDEAILIRVAGPFERVFAIELSPPRRVFVIDGPERDLRPAEGGKIRVEAVEEDAVLPDSTANVILKVETQRDA